MHILKMLAPLEELETKMAGLYEWFSRIFSEDIDASSFFYRVSVEEVVHANIIKYQRRLVTQNPKSFSEIDMDVASIRKVLSDIDAIRDAAEPPGLEDALRHAIDLEHSTAEEHNRTLIGKSNPEVERLLRGLGAFDCRHITCFHEFAAKRGFESIAGKFHLAQAEKSVSEASRAAAAAVDTHRMGRELLEKVEYLFTWQKTMGYYKFLGVREHATEQQIRHSYLKIVKEFHPDRYFGSPEDIALKLHAIIEYAVDAHETLSNPEKRRVYDAKLKSTVRH
ncbi:MAG: hypothetical protein C0402_00920 [Thermodesulfovibrio sp.]|nr:hypothetical protein [Thermodesulfovibrio sp.]